MPSATARSGELVEVADGILRLTMPLPFGIDHVHCYLLKGVGGWTVVDPGLGVDDTEALWEPLLARLDAPVERVFVTHYHPDHVGGAAGLAELVGVEVVEGELDRRQALQSWDVERAAAEFGQHLALHGMPADALSVAVDETDRLARRLRLAPAVELLDVGDTLDGWVALCFPGHADGHLTLMRDRVLIAGDVILTGITPHVGAYPETLVDPLGSYLDSLRRMADLDLSVVFTGHGAPVIDPARRAAEIVAHHARRLDEAEAGLGSRPASAYDISLRLFPAALPPGQRSFALAETLAHLEHLVGHERARRVSEDGGVRFVAAVVP